MTENNYQRLVEAVTEIWSHTLEADDGSVTNASDFFKAGGTSLTAMLAVARVERELGKAVPLSALVEHPTVSGFAKYLLGAADGVHIERTTGRNRSETQTEYLLHYNEAGRQAERNAKFEKYYAKAMGSAAHAEFCQKVYGKNFGQHGMADFAQIDEMLDRLKPRAGDVVLDVGCGYGLISQYIADRTGARVVGIDLSPSAIDYAKRLAETDTRLQFHVMDMRDIQFPSGMFSHIVSIDTIYYAPTLAATLEKFKEIGNEKLRIGILRTFPKRSFTRQTWSPHLTELAATLKELFGGYEAQDLSKEENEHWRKKVEVLQSLASKFKEEGNAELYQFRFDEAEYEASMEQFRCMFVSGR
jgi:cyclopropane fatty-acyl-phospholipid synthase-like methyltransferase/acyl carrier protein